MEMKILLVRN